MKTVFPDNSKPNSTSPSDKNGKFFFAIITITIIICLIIFYTAKASSAPTDTPDITNTKNYKSQAVSTYIIKNYQGKVAIFNLSTARDKPIKIYETYVSSLPISDQEALSEGIEIYDEAELQKIIEDLTS